MKKEGILSSNQLKVIALIAMTLDHLGVQIFCDVLFFRIIGRIAFPIFAYMIAEGCKFTRNRRRYLLNILSIAFLCQIVYFIFLKSLYQCIFVTFTLSVMGIYIIEYANEKKDNKHSVLAVGYIFLIYFAAEIVPGIFKNTDFYIDYGFFGICLPMLIYFANNRTKKLFMLTAGLILVALKFGGIQWFSLVSIIPMALYNGKRGKMNMKYLFYIYYPLHLVVIYLISVII